MDETRAATRTFDEVPCAACGQPVDPLRAARVAIFYEKFRYFCSAVCRAGYDPDAGRTPLPVPRRARRQDKDSSSPNIGQEPVKMARRGTAAALEAVESDVPSDAEARASRISAAMAALPASEPPEAPGIAVEDVPAPTDAGALLAGIAIVAGTLAAALFLLGPSPIAITARVLLVLVAAGSLVVESFSAQFDGSGLHPFAASIAPAAAAITALAARLVNSPFTSEAASFAGVLIASLAVIERIVERADHTVRLERDHIHESLGTTGHRIVGEEVADALPDDLRAGEEIVVEAGEVVPVDGTVVAGDASLHPWLDATVTVERGEDDVVLAGARVIAGRIRVIAAWGGNDRAFSRLTRDPRRRADLHAPLARLGQSIATRGSLIAAVAGALVAFSSDRDWVVITLFAIALYASLANAAVAKIAALHVAGAVHAALRRGVVFRTSESLDRAGGVSTAVFCARGTLLLGEPEIANIEPFGDFTADRVLSLVAGTEAGASHPTAIAVQRAARARGVRPDGVRSPSFLPGLGTTAVAATGQTLIVGSRGLMLRERVSVALAETRITDLEAMGRTVMLVALGGKLVGLLGLQDGLRPGARAAVQHLLDVGVEPVLLSGDTRETCEALGRAVDIDHIRPDVLPADRGQEIRRLSDGGAVLAVLGRSPNDDDALNAADVSVALDSAGSSSAEWNVQLASDDVRDAAFALRLAHDCRKNARLGLVLVMAPSMLSALLLVLGLVPVFSLALAALAGSSVAFARLRTRS